MKLIEGKNLSKNYIVGKNKKIALDSVSFSLEEGEFVGLVGESGSGKSTLAKILIGLIKPDVGEVQSLESKKNRMVQMIPQNPYGAFDPLATMEVSLVEPLLAHKIITRRKEGRELVREKLSDYGLSEDSLDKYPGEFSGGQLQRLGILRGMLLEPKVLIADEIISALDSHRKLAILELLKNLQLKDGLSILFITHDIAVIQNFADRIIVMRAGRIVEEGPTKEILLSPKDKYTKELLEAVPKI
ncbi:MAG: ABC transporter ATP-binding protein [Tissierellia bacterium]|nr:ABC transporter ATP-binding protein [Tissierellia bacterium]